MLNTIPEAIEAIKAGKTIIVVDDEDRENEGDFLTAAHNATPETINFMVKYGRGLVCAPITEKRARELDLEPMVSHNTTSHETNFTVRSTCLPAVLPVYLHQTVQEPYLH